jgi:hypothetical protein
LAVLTRHLSRSTARLGLAVVVALGGLLVCVLRAAHGSEPPKPLLPNLVADPPGNAQLATDVESSGGPPRLLLRFYGYVHNTGPGAIDFRGSREAPQVSQKTIEEVERAREKEAGLSQETEEELATPPMKVSQRLFLPIEGESQAEEKQAEANIERVAHTEEPSEGEMIYVDADGHHHWHLQKVAKYSLWNSTKTAEVAPSQKVGFCLEDSQHVELEKGPETPAYADNVYPYRQFCQQYNPDATKVYEGISPGWRDIYKSELAFQWVDVSDVPPGEYWLREDVNPTGAIEEEPDANEPAYATKRTIVPGFDAQAQVVGAQQDEARTVTLTAQAWRGEENGGVEEALPTPSYTVVTPPRHGTLGAIEGDRVTYTPEGGYSGTDSFTFSAADPQSAFPIHPELATVSVDVGDGTPRPSVSIGGAPASMIAGTSVDLSAAVANDTGGVEWIASDGAFTAEAPQGLKDDYVAPSVVPPGGTVTVTARLKDDHGVSDQRTIAVLPVSTPVPSPEAPPSSKTTTRGTEESGSPQAPSGVSRPSVTLIGRKLIMTTFATVAGRVRLSAYLGRRRLGTCVTRTPADRAFTCRLTLGEKVSLHAQISVWASLRIGRRVLRSLRPAARVAQMKMARASALGSGGGGGTWCSPSMAAMPLSPLFAQAGSHS